MCIRDRLKAGSGESLNMKGAYLEVWSDMLGSVGVILGALVIKLTGWTVMDPIIAVLIGLWVLPRTWTLLRAATQMLMQGVPAGLDLEAVRSMMLAHANVQDVHDPVSYTHLDVYKRQSWNRPVACRCWWSRRIAPRWRVTV